MKLFLLSAFGMMVAMSVAPPDIPLTGLEQQLKKLKELADERATFFKDFLGGGEQAADGEGTVAGEARHCAKSRPIGLQIGSLASNSRQSATGVHSGARGLTPEDEWRRMFPHKPGYSR
jgi:hypothetical protein